MEDKLHFCILFMLSVGLVFCLMIFGKHYIILESVLMLVTCIYLGRAYCKLYKVSDKIELLLWRYWFYRIPTMYIAICVFLLLWNKVSMLSASTNLAFISSIVVLSKLMETILKKKKKIKIMK